MLLSGKSAVITGSTSGIGLGIARALAQAGADVVLNGFGEASAIEDLRSGIAREFGIRASFSNANVANAKDIIGMIEAAEGELGHVAIMVNNAGIQYTASIEAFPIEQWDMIIAINLSSNFHAIRAVLPKMRQRNWGRIINVASTHGLVASAD